MNLQNSSLRKDITVSQWPLVSTVKSRTIDYVTGHNPQQTRLIQFSYQFGNYTKKKKKPVKQSKKFFQCGPGSRKKILMHSE